MPCDYPDAIPTDHATNSTAHSMLCAPAASTKPVRLLLVTRCSAHCFSYKHYSAVGAIVQDLPVVVLLIRRVLA